MQHNILRKTSIRYSLKGHVDKYRCYKNSYTKSGCCQKKLWSIIYYRCARPSQSVTQFGDQTLSIMVKARKFVADNFVLPPKI